MLADAILEGLNPEQRDAVRDHRGPAARARRRGQRQDARAHPPHRLADRRLRHRARGDPRGHLHQQGRRRDARARREAARRRRPPASGSRPSTRSACASCAARSAISAARAASRSTTRPTRSALVKRGAAAPRRSTRRSPTPRRMRWRIDQWKNQGLLPAAAAERRARPRGASAPPTSTRTYQRAARRRERARLRRPAAAHRASSSSASPRCSRHYQRRWQYVLVDEYQDTNRVQYRLRAASSPREHRQPVRGRRPGPVDLRAGAAPTSATSSTSSATIPDAQVVKLERNYRSTQPILDGRQRRGREQPRRAASKRCSPSASGGEPIRAVRGARRPRGGAVRGARASLRRRARGGPRLRRLRDLLPHQRAVAAVRGGAAQVRRALRRGRRRALLRPRRGEGRARLPAAGAEPGRRRRRCAGS